MTTRRQPRSLERAGYTDKNRIQALEHDADECEDAQDELVTRFDTELASLRRVLIGLLVTVAASAIGVMLTVVVTR